MDSTDYLASIILAFAAGAAVTGSIDMLLSKHPRLAIVLFVLALINIGLLVALYVSTN